MKILLVEPAYYSQYPPLGLLKLSRLRKDRGDEVRFDSTDHARSLADGLRTRRLWPDSPTEADSLQHYLDEQGRRHRESYARAAREFASKAEHKDKKKQKQRRRAVMRSAAAAETILGRGSVMTLARGEPIFLEGSEFTFRVAVRHLRAGHGGVNVSLESRGGQRLTDLCLYFEDTPALEQAAAMALHIQSGDELDLLLTGNPFNVTAAGASHPLVADRLAQRRDETRQAALDLQHIVNASRATPGIASGPSQPGSPRPEPESSILPGERPLTS